MSGVLDRMARRARKALPRIEPRGMALFTASAPVFASMRPPVALDEAALSHGKRQSLAAQSQERVPDVDCQVLPNEPPQQRVPCSTVRRDDSWTAETPQRQTLRSTWLETSDAPIAPEELPIQRRFNPAVQGGGMQEVAPDRLQQGHAQVPVSVVTRERRGGALSVQSLAEGNLEKREQAGIEGPTTASRSVSARSRPSSAADGLASEDTKAEVHISIGSIELRAPRADVPHQSAAFRPQVTLADYLGRRR